MKKKLLLSCVLFSVFALWITTSSAQENKTNVPPISLKHRNLEVIKSNNGNDRGELRSVNLAGFNLTPYQPTGWDDKIVLSTATGTHTSAATILNNQNIYLDWAIINNGSSDITQTFTVNLYIDGTLSDNIDIQGLKSGYYVSASDWAYSPFSAGSHTFKIVADAGNTVSENDESDNEYSLTKTITYTEPCVNLSFFQPSGWDNKLVLSTVRGTNSTASTIYSNETIYADWAVRNIGGCGTTLTFNVNILVDGVLANSFPVNGLDYGSSISVFDREIGPFSAGLHTFRVVCDANNLVNEIDETDNEYSINFTTTALTTGVEPLENSKAINIYPNPFSNELVIEFKGNTEMVDYEILNSSGKAISSGKVSEKTCVNTSTFLPGIYMLKYYNNKISGIKKIIKE
jgi:subtilase family serine protease